MIGQLLSYKFKQEDSFAYQAMLDQVKGSLSSKEDEEFFKKSLLSAIENLSKGEACFFNPKRAEFILKVDRSNLAVTPEIQAWMSLEEFEKAQDDKSLYLFIFKLESTDRLYFSILSYPKLIEMEGHSSKKSILDRVSNGFYFSYIKDSTDNEAHFQYVSSCQKYVLSGISLHKDQIRLSDFDF